MRADLMPLAEALFLALGSSALAVLFGTGLMIFYL